MPSKSSRSKITSATILFGFIVTLGICAYAQQKPEQLAQHSSEAWLGLVDSGEYAESW